MTKWGVFVACLYCIVIRFMFIEGVENPFKEIIEKDCPFENPIRRISSMRKRFERCARFWRHAGRGPGGTFQRGKVLFHQCDDRAEKYRQNKQYARKNPHDPLLPY